MLRRSCDCNIELVKQTMWIGWVTGLVLIIGTIYLIGKIIS